MRKHSLRPRCVSRGASVGNARRVEARLIELLATRTGKLSAVHWVGVSW